MKPFKYIGTCCKGIIWVILVIIIVPIGVIFSLLHTAGEYFEDEWKEFLKGWKSE